MEGTKRLDSIIGPQGEEDPRRRTATKNREIAELCTTVIDVPQIQDYSCYEPYKKSYSIGHSLFRGYRDHVYNTIIADYKK